MRISSSTRVEETHAHLSACAGYDGSAGTIPGGYPFTEQITDPAARTRALTCELQNGRAAMLGTFGAMCHSCVDSCDHHFFYPITHN